MSQNKVKVFENEQFGQIRVELINNEPWFVGKDVADALGYSDTAQAVRDHFLNSTGGCHFNHPLIFIFNFYIEF